MARERGCLADLGSGGISGGREIFFQDDHSGADVGAGFLEGTRLDVFGGIAAIFADGAVDVFLLMG